MQLPTAAYTIMHLDRPGGRLLLKGQVFDPATRTWERVAEFAADSPDLEPVTALQAATWLQRESGTPCRVPVAVLGTRAATPEQIQLAEDLGRHLGGIGLTVVCGGREGVMEAVCRGVAAAGGTSLGLLPDDSWDAANTHVTIPVATGLGVARNAVIARAALCAVAVGGGYGTISEAAFCLQFSRSVFGLAGAPDLPGVQHCEGAEAAAGAVARVVLALPPPGAG
jgi:uncharacterized protein (TIGR00725 family)